ncbi:MAG: hypothetical protein R3E96_07795 [Planctomycetota bacterium]
MSTTEISTLQTPSGDPGHSFGRTLAWIGLSLVCLVLGAAFGVWGLGESMLGPSVTRSRFRALNDRIVGLLEHDSSRLRWNEPSRIEGLRLKSGDGTTLAAGDLEVPALFDSAWHGDHLLPAKASLQLSELHLGFDAAGAVRLLSQLALRSAAATGQPAARGIAGSRRGVPGARRSAGPGR